jgi:SAM-dependent methyltransferase
MRIPAHSAKVGYALENIICFDRLFDWLSYGAEAIVIDVGCGAGAASVAFANCLLKLRESRFMPHPISVHFIGIDPNEYAIAIYHQQITGLISNLKKFNINGSYSIIPEGDLEAVNQLREKLAERRELLNVPFLGHVFLFQANVVSPFSALFQERQLKRQNMLALGIPEESLSDLNKLFGQEEAMAYKQILESTFIDNLHVITVGTNGYEERVAELAQAIDLEFRDNNHVVRRFPGGQGEVEYELLNGCYWKDFKENDCWKSVFHVEVSSICSVALADEDWQSITSNQNLMAAWARARHHLLEQPLVDEIEVRLFESRLESNIARLQKQLIAYAQDVVHSDDRLHFKFPKSSEKLRPLGLSRIEEEILSTALIQNLGQKIAGITSRSYAYKFARNYNAQNSEYLYESWFDAYRKYVQEAQEAARSVVGCVIIQTDIKSFYTRIIRDNLTQLSTEHLSRSARIEWLLKLLFSRDLDEHEVGKGIVQGNLASGFFANLYLVDLDARFGPNNEWNVRFFRFVDDMVFVVPDREHVEDVISALTNELEKLGLEPNLEKTQYYSDAAEFIQRTTQDNALDELHNRFRRWMNCLWIMDDANRQLFRRAYKGSQDEWWYRVNLYAQCLRSVGVDIDSSQISRRIYKYLFNDRQCQKDLWDKPFIFVQPPDTEDELQIAVWRSTFESSNSAWLDEKKHLTEALESLLLQSHVEIRNAAEHQDTHHEKRWTASFRFCLNRLTQIGLHRSIIAQTIVDVLLESPWLVKNPDKLSENLALHGYTQHIESLLLHYIDETDAMKEYLKAVILRSIGFLSEVPLVLWEQVVLSAVSASPVISLMATETWLRVVQKNPHLVKDDQLRKIEFAVQAIPRPLSRLLKNYLLILGEDGRTVKAAAFDLY